jgi:hypothetical protein
VLFGHMLPFLFWFIALCGTCVHWDKALRYLHLGSCIHVVLLLVSWVRAPISVSMAFGGNMWFGVISRVRGNCCSYVSTMKVLILTDERCASSLLNMSIN